MPDAGDSTTATLTVSPFSGSTVATLVVTSPAGVITTPTATTINAGATWTAPVTYATAGEWILSWTVTGTGAGTEFQRTLIAPAPVTTGRTLATTADLAAWLDAAPPEGARRLLRRATMDIDRVTMSAVYDVDSVTFLPTDTDVAAALRDATCELVSHWVESGDETGLAATYTTVTIGSVSLGRSSAAANAAVSPLPQIPHKVMTILLNAGLIGGLGPVHRG